MVDICDIHLCLIVGMYFKIFCVNNQALIHNQQHHIFSYYSLTDTISPNLVYVRNIFFIHNHRKKKKLKNLIQLITTIPKLNTDIKIRACSHYSLEHRYFP